MGKLVLKEGQTAGIRTDQSKESNPALEKLFRPEEEEIEWLSKIKNEVDKIDGGDNIIEIADVEEDQSQGGQIEPLKMIRKGAVAAVGGTMTAVGLVMIPLPTPFGAVVASAGLGVLGTEFQEAKELNEKLIDGAKGHLNTARDAIVNGIERMNDGDDDPNPNRDDRDNNNNIYNDDNDDDGNNNNNHNNNNNTNASNPFMDTKVNCNNDANIDNSINAPVPDNHSTDTSDEENEREPESENGVNHTPTKNRNEDNDDKALP